jgi:general secretion pathway protein K
LKPAAPERRNLASGHRDGERGLALLIVLWVIVAASLVVLTFNATVRSGLTFVSSEVEMTRSDALLDAGAEIAVSRLIDAEEGMRWRADGKSHTVSYAGADLIIAISDANGLIDINKADKMLLIPFLRQFLGSEANAVRLGDAILLLRTKASQSLPPPAESHTGIAATQSEVPKGLPFIDVAQLRSVNGMTPELYKRMVPFVTVYSRDGRIAPISAPNEVLAAIPNVTPADIDRLRSAATGTKKELAAAIADFSRHAGPFLTSDPGPAYVVSVGVRRPGGKYAAGRVYVVATGLDTNAPYRLISKRPIGSAMIGSVR